MSVWVCVGVGVSGWVGGWVFVSVVGVHVNGLVGPTDTLAQHKCTTS